LTADERQRAWRTAFLFSLDQHADLEISWEAERWRELGAPGIAQLCGDLLVERRADDFTIPTEATPEGLTLLWRRVPRDEALAWVRSGAICLVAAVRLLYWRGASAEELAA
jgi:hypothetical protein